MHAYERQPGSRNAQRDAVAPTRGRGAAIVGGALTPQMVLALQRTVGNAAVVQLLQRRRQDAEHACGPACGHPGLDGSGEQVAPVPVVQRSTVHDVLRSPGRPLDPPLRTEMETRLGADFTDVRLHTGAAAAQSAAGIGARAYTSGNHVVIGEGGTDKLTLAHELTHVIQQWRGPVAGTDHGDGLSVSDPSDRFERDAETNARRAMAMPVSDAHLLQRAVSADTPESHAQSAAMSSFPVQRWYSDQALPRTVRDVDIERKDGLEADEVEAFVDGLSRSGLDWYKDDDDESRDTRAQVIRAARQAVGVDPFTDRPLILYQCGSCQNATTYAGIDIGHIVDWKAYLKMKGVTDRGEAMAAYNDLNNLQLECATCNRSHAWEVDEEGDYLDGGEPEYDSGSDLGKFIVPG